MASNTTASPKEVPKRYVSITHAMSFMIDGIDKAITDKLGKFNKSQVLKHGLILKPDNHEYNISHRDGNTSRRKLFSRMKSLFKSALIKSAPYMKFAEVEFLEAVDTHNIQVTISTPKGIRDFSIGQSDVYLGITVNNSASHNLPEYKMYSRYSRYLNYIFRKYRIPYSVTLKSEIHFDSLEFNEVMAMNTGSEKDAKKISNHICYILTFTPVTWAPRSSLTRNELEALQLVIKNEGITPMQLASARDSLDKMYADYSMWSKNNYDALSSTYRMERVFLNLDKVQTMFKTLARKVNYGYKPYIFKASEL